MRLDPSALRYLTRDDFRVLTAVEMGQKNHELVPVELVTQIASLRLGGVGRILSTLLRNKLLHHDRTSFDGYRLTNLGFDFLALRTFLARDTISGVGRQIGVGKESDIFIVGNDDGEEMCLKVHRLGRTSFKAVKSKRDYHANRGSPSWLYLSRLAATKEFTFMKVLREHDFPVPRPIDSNRHGIVMSLVNGFTLNQVRKMPDPEPTYVKMMNLIERFAKHGLIHGDFNEFNLMINEEGELTVIDFPQMVSIRHPNARMYFERDVNCVRRFFRKRFNFFHELQPDFDDCVANIEKDLDKVVSASGFSYKMAKEFDRFVEHKNEADTNDSEDEDDESDDESEHVASGNLSESEQVEKEAGESRETNLEEEAVLSNKIEKIKLLDEGEEAPPDGAQEVFVEENVIERIGSQSDDKAISGETSENCGDSVGAVDDEENEEESVDDSPDAYKVHDYASQAPSQAYDRMDDVRRRVRRDFTRKSKLGQKKKVASRNNVKNRERRKLHNEIQSERNEL